MAFVPSAAAVRLVELGEAGAARTQAVYHAVAQCQSARSPDTVILVRPREPYLCLGWHDVLASVLDVGACALEGLPILRRQVGGGTTYLNPAQPFYQFIFHHSRVPALSRDLYAYLLSAPVLALRRMGFPAMLRDGNEIEVGGRRIAGVGGGRIGEAAVVVGNILCDFDYTILPRVWNAPWPDFRELAAEALHERVTTLCRLGGTVDPDVVMAALKGSLSEALGRPVLPAPLQTAELEVADRLEPKLSEPAFLALHGERGGAPMRRLKITAGVFIHGETVTVGASTLRATLRERDGRIESALVDGALGRHWPAAALALTGTPMAGWRERLAEAGA